MSRLVIVVEVEADPTLVDPHEIAADVLDEYEDYARHNDGWRIGIMHKAEWDD